MRVQQTLLMIVMPMVLAPGGAVAAIGDAGLVPPVKRTAVSATAAESARAKRAPVHAPAPSEHFAAMHAGAAGQAWKI